MIFWHFWKYYVIMVDETPVELRSPRHVLHQHLEHSWGIHQSERHMITIVKSQWANSECHQWLRSLIHLDLPITWLECQWWKPKSPTQTVQSFFYPGETIWIFDSLGIQFSQVNAKLELMILLTYQYDWAIPRLCNGCMAPISSISFRYSLTSSYILAGIWL